MTKLNDMKLIEILLQDLKCSIEYFDTNNFRSMNTLANRIMENCLFNENFKLFLPGIMIRDISFDYEQINKINPRKNDEAKEIGKKFLNYLLENFKIDLDEKLIWENFHNYSIEIRKFQSNEIELNCYKENLEFSDFIFWELMQFLNKNKNKLLDISNNFFDGIINLIVRIIHNHSCSLKNIMVYIYIQSIFGLYQYILRKNLNNIATFRIDIENELFPYIDYITTRFVKTEIKFEEFDKKLWQIVKRMRELYIIYKPSPTP